MSDGSDDADPLLRAIAAAPARSPPPLGAARVTVGELVAGRFVIGSIARKEDASTRFHATDRENGASVVVAIACARWADGDHVAHQLAELAALSHPALARPIATGALPDGSAVVISEALDGAPLTDYLTRQGALSVSDCVQLARRLADALAALHARGLVHGDVETANVHLPGNDLAHAKLTGATHARLHPRSKAMARATASGEHACYSPPELVRGVTDLDARADVFALGCVLFECLTGKPPFAGATEAAATAKLLVERAPRVRTQRAEVPAALDAMLAAMLEHDRQNRPNGGGELVRALSLLQDGSAQGALSAAAIATGVVLVDRYEITRELGRGGMGRVFAARDRRLARDVAIKLLIGEATDSRAFSRLEQEARAASRINHPNIATVHDVLATDQGPCIVSELLQGATLADTLASSGARPADEARALGVQLAAGLAAAHERAVLHRDLKPANLFITTDGRLKILDFGLAKFLEPDPNAPSTEEGTVLGTVGYMSPEQVRGVRVDARSDLFSAGIVLYEALVGRRPFEGASRYEVESRILQQPPAALPANIPADLAATVLRCLEKDAALRFQSARELAAALDGSAPSSSAKAARAGRRAAIWSIVAAAGVLVALASGAAVWRSRSRAPAATVPTAPPAIAVLPFRDLSADHSQAYLADGLAEEILTSLARVQGLHVVARTSSFAFRDATDDAGTIARKLGVGMLVEGSVQRAGTRVRVSARLINASDGYQLWAQEFDRDATDLLAIEDEVTRDVIGTLKVKLLPGEHALPPNRGSHDPEAYNDYLLAGRKAEGGTYQDDVEARRYIERALARDPSFAAAWARYSGILGHTVFTDGVYDPALAADLFARAKTAADKAIALDPNLPDGYVARAGRRYESGEWNLEGARSDLERALTLDPNNIGALGRKAQLLLYFSNRVDEGIAAAKRTIELNPIGKGWAMLGFGYRRAGRLAEAKAAFQRFEEIRGANAAFDDLAEIEIREGHPEKALARIDAAPRSQFEYYFVVRTLVLVALHRDAEARGTVREYEGKLRSKNNSRSAYLGAAYAMIGDLDRAFAIFDDCLAHGDIAIAHVMVGPWTQELRENPRYKAFVAKMHLLD